MNTSFKISFPLGYVFGVIFLIVSSSMTCSAAEKKKIEELTDLELPIDCRPYHMRGVKAMFKNFNKCSRQLKANTTKDGKFNDKEYEENIGCAMKCTFRAMEFSKNDIVTQESIRTAVAKLLPKVLVEIVSQTLSSKCHEKYGDKLDPAEAHCKSYSEYAFCVQNGIADLVESDYCIKYDKKGNPISPPPDTK